jgi:hypothetical protein
VVAKYGQTFVEFPPIQAPATFNMEAIKEQVTRAIHSHAGQ